MSDTIANGGTVTADDLNAEEAAQPEVEQTAVEPQPDYASEPAAMPPEPPPPPAASDPTPAPLDPQAAPASEQPQHRILAMFEGLAQGFLHLSQSPANSGLANIAQMILGHVAALRPEPEAPPPVETSPLSETETARLAALRQAQSVTSLPQALMAELNSLAEREAVPPAA